MESLGFAHAPSVWSEAPTTDPAQRRGRHETHLADSRPGDFGGHLSGGNVRWGLVAAAIVLLGGLTAVGYRLYQGPAAQEQASISEVTSEAIALRSSLPTLEAFNAGLLATESDAWGGDLFEVEARGRALFNASGALPNSQTDMRLISSQAAGSTLDAVRLASGAHSFRSAVLPVLVTPGLQTDPELIGLDEAARTFGEWQLSFDTARRAVSESILPDVGAQLDLLSSDLGSFLSRYVDALRLDDRSEAESVLRDLGSRLEGIDATLTVALEEVQAKVAERVEETNQALERLLSN
jgi:hypothetical protein